MASITVHCPRCNSGSVYRHGKTPAGHVRYPCPLCPHVFQLTYTYEARKPGVKNKIVDMAFNSSGVRDIARVLKIGINTFLCMPRNYLSDAGSNIDPALYGQENLTPEKQQDRDRDLFDLPLIKGARGRGLPILAICRGMQKTKTLGSGPRRRWPDRGDPRPCHLPFLLAVQWHPEWKARENPCSIKIFQAFGDACRKRQAVNSKT